MSGIVHPLRPEGRPAPKAGRFQKQAFREHDSCFRGDMLDRDFFGFCTTLKPLGAEGDRRAFPCPAPGRRRNVYSPGDPGDAIYIINRGVVEVVQRSRAKVAPDTYLSRGDIFGDVEVLTERPRKYLVRTCEPVSLQCFQRENFPELVRRVPSFFHYLSEQLAFRLAQASDLTLAQSHCLELSGNLSNFDLVTIYQTIVNSSQTGELRISNESGELISAFFFEKGQPRCGQFEHLTGEEAFWQLFVSEELAGTFAFSAKELPVKDWIQSERITKNAGEMLINALQGRDEFAELKQRFDVEGATLQRHKANLSWPAEAPPESKAVAEQIWQLAAKGPVTVLDLFHHCAVCELKMYQVVEELVQSHHSCLVGAGREREGGLGTASDEIALPHPFPGGEHARMFDVQKEGQQDRTYKKYLKKMKAQRERDRKRSNEIRQRAEMPTLRSTPPPEISVQTSESE